jgi:hypothetical protein
MYNERINEYLQMEPARIEDAELEMVAGGLPPIFGNTDKVTTETVTVCCWP